MEQKKSNIVINIIKILLFLVIAALLYFRVEQIFEERTSSDKYSEFFKEKQDFPVLFMGNSHVTNGIYPMELYKDYGIVSYNFGGHGNTIPTTYWIAENALDYTSPKLMVVDVKLLGANEMHNEKVRYLHVSLDCFPMSKTKLSAINDLLTKEERAEFLWKMWVYHDRWKELTKEDFTGLPNLEKGAETRINVSEKAIKREHEDFSTLCDMEGTGVGYLRRLIEDCQNRNIDVLLIYMPLSAEDEDMAEMNTAKLIADEYGINYVNLNDENLVDYDIDFFDNNGHLNPSGARKVTAYLGKYINENYNIPDLRDDESYSSWKEDARLYSNMKYDNLKNEEELKNFLLLLKDDDYSFDVTVYDEAVLKDELVQKLLDNAGADSITVEAKPEGETAGIYIRVKAAGDEEVLLERAF